MRWAETFILSDEQVDAKAEGLPILWDPMCSGETSEGCRGCECGKFLLVVTRSFPTAGLYVDSQYISLTLQ